MFWSCVAVLVCECERVTGTHTHKHIYTHRQRHRYWQRYVYLTTAKRKMIQGITIPLFGSWSQILFSNRIYQYDWQQNITIEITVRYVPGDLNTSEAEDGKFKLWGSIPCLLMPWLLKLPGHQQQWSAGMALAVWNRQHVILFQSQFHLDGSSQIQYTIWNVNIPFVIFKTIQHVKN